MVSAPAVVEKHAGRPAQSTWLRLHERLAVAALDIAPLYCVGRRHIFVKSLIYIGLLINNDYSMRNENGPRPGYRCSTERIEHLRVSNAVERMGSIGFGTVHALSDSYDREAGTIGLTGIVVDVLHNILK
ncbi:hypothetical protein H3V53_37295 [Paraburkholderia bengalensis]|uniref:Uncharacterized protein n=1 Tax=Paraburkholderia bengalensis TaxID=2747562 RepID=A0ABU8J4F0_9BURK